ncbi:MAG TPA: hypothetical protein VJ373_08140, partial [Desulfatiglandales bacterium]|nr:hypothetical protein [Desulfatiglandales bacterium]
IIKPKDFGILGINPADIPPGAYAAHRHPTLLSSRFGGNAYGFGFFEIYSHLGKEDIALLQSITFDDPEQIKEHYETINRIYARIGLLIRFSALGRPYYIIPHHLLSISITNIKIRADEISKIINLHHKKYPKEGHKIGVLTYPADPIMNDLTLRFKQHQFFTISSPDILRSIKEPLDMVILTRDLYKTILHRRIDHHSGESPSKKQLERHAIYLLGKIFKILKPDGEIFIISNHQALKTNRNTKIEFKTIQEQKKFLIFTHIFKTHKRYRIKDSSLPVNVYDLERYLGALYVEKDVIDRLSGGKDLEEMTLDGINELPYLDLPLHNEYDYDQQKVWSRLISIYFDEIFLKPLIPNSIRTGWKKRFKLMNYSPNYMLVCLAKRKPASSTVSLLKTDVTESKLSGCPLPLLADYRDSFDYLIRTLNVLKYTKNKSYVGLSRIFMERLREPFENKSRRYVGFNHVLKLISKIPRLKRIQSSLNPDMIEGSRTKVLENLELLPFLGFSYEELKEIFLIIVGHTTGGRILSGKLGEKTLQPVTDLARTYSHQDALNLLRYCSLMSMAETVASRKADMDETQLFELLDLFDSALRVVMDRNMDWYSLLEEKISAMGGIHNKLIHRLLKMNNHLEFLNTWPELIDKGDMEKESLADYDNNKLAKIDDVLGLIRNIEQIENKFLRDNPLQLPIIYRKFLDMEFHGTEHLFARMDSQLVFTLLWLTVNVTHGDIINFNPILSDVKYSEFDNRLKKVEDEARVINKDYLDLSTLKDLSKQLYKNNSAFILNTGFRLSLNHEIQSMDISFIDMDEDIIRLDYLAKRFADSKSSEIPIKNLEEMERLFANLEDFYHGHQLLISSSNSRFKIPERQRRWFKKVKDLRGYLKLKFTNVIFEPENIFTNLDRLFHFCPSILRLVHPELMVLHDLILSGNLYLKSSIMDHILNSAKKIQALIRGTQKEFQDFHAQHRLAQREFGPMASGIIGLNESQIGQLISTVNEIRLNRTIFNAFIKTFIFHDLGLTPSLRESYKEEINMADQAQAGALFFIKEKIAQRYAMDMNEEKSLTFLIKHHNHILYLVRGEVSLHALKEIIDTKDKDIFKAFFVSSFIMFSSLGEGQATEDLAIRLFNIRNLCLMIMDGKTSLDDLSEEIYAQKGLLLYRLEEFYGKGIPKGTSPSEYMESWQVIEAHEGDYSRAGKKVVSMERIFRLRGLRYVEFIDVAKYILKVPLPYIYQKRDYHAIGYATFEKELLEASHIYNSIQRLSEDERHFMLEQLIADKIRISGFENIGTYLNYENLIKLLLIAILGAQRFQKDARPIYLNFLNLDEKIDKRYEALNDALNNLSQDALWKDGNRLTQLFKAKTGLLLGKNDEQRVLTVDFVDWINASAKIAHMDKIKDIDRLKNYYHYSLKSLRKSPFFTGDYEQELEKSFNRRLAEIIDLLLGQAKTQMELLTDFREIHNLYDRLLNRSLEIGFSNDQKHRLHDLYELRKDNLKRKKLEEIIGQLGKINDRNGLKKYWDEIKYYLQNNRQFVGKEFENLIAKAFDRANKKIKDMSFETHFIN